MDARLDRILKRRVSKKAEELSPKTNTSRVQTPMPTAARLAHLAFLRRANAIPSSFPLVFPSLLRNPSPGPVSAVSNGCQTEPALVLAGWLDADRELMCVAERALGNTISAGAGTLLTGFATAQNM